MPLTMRVHPELDERAKRRAVEDAERTFGGAGTTSSAEFSGMFTKGLADNLNDRALDSAVSRLESRFARAGTISLEKFNAALIAESARTGIAADKIGAELMMDPDIGIHIIEPLKSRGVIRTEEFNMVLGVKCMTKADEGRFDIRREAYHRIPASLR